MRPRFRGCGWRLALLLALHLLPVESARGAGPVAEAEVLAASVSPDGAARLAATASLARLATPAARDRLRLMAHADRDPRVRVSAIRLLAGSRDPEVGGLLRAIAVNDPDPTVRGEAAGAQGRVEAFDRRPGRAAGYGLLCPGCGYFYLRQPGQAARYLGATAALLGTGLALLDGRGSPMGEGPGPRMQPTTAPLALPLLNAAQNLWFYGVFASYRDARLRRGDEGYTYPVSREELPALALAPFRPSVLSRPWFWAGLPVLLGAAIAYSAVLEPDEPGRGNRTLGEGGGVWFLGRRFGTRTGFALGEAYFGGLFLPVGVGEEALFRGVLQPGLSEQLGLWPGWALASVIFGAIHTFNFLGEEDGLRIAARAVPFITATGSYLGLVAIRTGFQLETSVALHFWYNFLLGTTGFLFDPDNQPFALRFGLPF